MTEENPIAMRSKQTIVTAFMDLLQQKAYEKITIKEIMEKANMARRTFYGNFSSKEEILQYYFKQLFERLTTLVKKKESRSIKETVETLFQLVLEDKDNMVTVKKQGLFNLAMLEKYTDEVAHLLKGREQVTDDLMRQQQMALRYMPGFYLGGLWRVLDQWLGEGAQISPKKMAEMFQGMLKTMNG